MLLAVDIGNSNIKFGIFDGSTLLSKSCVSTKTASTSESLRSAIGSSLDLPIEHSIVCSVVPEADDAVTSFLRQTTGNGPLFVKNDLDLGLKIKYYPPTSLGTDRLINCFAAVEKYGAPVIVCSFGTASTFDAVSEDTVLLGGVIAPGMKVMAAALHRATSKLPEVEAQKPPKVLGNTTASAIESGIFFGHIALVEGVVERITQEMGMKTRVIATGGWAGIVAETTSSIDHVDEDLLFDGLRMIFERTG
jgi:type III pantothenate kinase